MMGIFVLTGIAFIISIILVYADYKLDKRSKFVEEVVNYLPGYNCGSCGFGGCIGMADAIGKDPLSYKKCRPLKGVNLKEMEVFLKENNKL